jgi:hypothetical protein
VPVRNVDGPPKVWSSVREAAKWLGVSYGFLLREIRDRPELLPTTKLGGGDKIFWLDLVCYNQIRPRLKIVDDGAEEEKS